MIRLVATDVDGTLLTSGHVLTPGVVRAVARARAAGVEVVLATSRPPPALWPIVRALGLFAPAPFIASQGALVGSYSATGELAVLDRRPMPVELAREAVAAGAAAGLSVSWLASQRWLVEAIDEPIRVEAAITGCQPEVADLAAEELGPDKLLLLAPDDRPQLIARFRAPPGLVALASTPTHLEVNAVGVDKGVALAGVCRSRRIDPAEVAAIGDGRNDLGMLRFAGLAVAPANAHPEVLAAADLVVPGNDDDGVATALALLLR